MTARTVYKYPFSLHGLTTVTLPEGAQVLHADRDPAYPEGQGALALWALVDPTVPPDVRTPLVVLGTGHGCPPNTGEHIGSTVDGPFVWHIFRAVGA